MRQTTRITGGGGTALRATPQDIRQFVRVVLNPIELVCFVRCGSRDPDVRASQRDLENRTVFNPRWPGCVV